MPTPRTYFYPRPPRGGRPSAHTPTLIRQWHFYPRPPRGGRRVARLALVCSHMISIHALREEGDRRGTGERAGRNIFLSTPSARRATMRFWQMRQRRTFLSTPSARRATWWILFYSHQFCHFYPRPPRGGRLHELLCKTVKIAISIHALREEGDARVVCAVVDGDISIHALREEGDHQNAAVRRRVGVISIHALREEGDPSCSSRAAGASYFYPRPPRGGRPPYGAAHEHQGSISIHALREEGDISPLFNQAAAL